MDLSLIFTLLSDYPNLTTFFAVVGFLRTINKPFFALLRMWAQSTSSTKDDETLNKIEASPQYKTLTFLLDWLASVKLPKKEK
jgi:hypothetical protein